MGRSKKKRGPLGRVFRWGLRFFLKTLVLVLLLTVAQVLVLKFMNPPFTVQIAWGWIERTVKNEKRRPPIYEWRSLAEISPHLRRAVLAGEDQRFLLHHGFDFIEIQDALRDILHTRRVRGASTISMQVARTVFLWQSRSVLRKIAEAYYTVLIEFLWSKGRILEMYLNTVDWGTGVMGAEAASHKYFGTSARRLSSSQAALLSAILPNPHRWSPTDPSRYVRERQRRIMRDMSNMPLVRDG